MLSAVEKQKTLPLPQREFFVSEAETILNMDKQSMEEHILSWLYFYTVMYNDYVETHNPSYFVSMSVYNVLKFSTSQNKCVLKGRLYATQ